MYKKIYWKSHGPTRGLPGYCTASLDPDNDENDYNDDDDQCHHDGDDGDGDDGGHDNDDDDDVCMLLTMFKYCYKLYLFSWRSCNYFFLDKRLMTKTWFKTSFLLCAIIKRLILLIESPNELL